MASKTKTPKAPKIEDEITIRGKWVLDGAKTLEEAAQKFEAEAAYLRKLKSEGWEFTHPVQDDYGHASKK